MKSILVLTFGIVLATSLAAQSGSKECKQKCDCSHWPWTSKCKNCCGTSSGIVLSEKDNELRLLTKDGAETFKVTSDTKFKGKVKRGERANVFYKISVNETMGTTDQVATVITEAPAEEKPKPTGPPKHR